ncbi:MAG: hypothetical protein M1812_000997 [Candelaria pacifica]|nr:MAG: hypothetical protein M1812_000997 [Candelaria pacifica]
MRCLRLPYCAAHNQYSTLKALQSTFVLQLPISFRSRRDVHQSVPLQAPQGASAKLPGEPKPSESQGRFSLSRRKKSRTRGREPNHDGDIKVNSLDDTLKAHRATNLASKIRNVNASANLPAGQFTVQPQYRIRVPSASHQPSEYSRTKFDPKRRIELGFPNLILARTTLRLQNNVRLVSSNNKSQSMGPEVKLKSVEYTGCNVLPKLRYGRDISNALTTPSPWLASDTVLEARSDPFHRLHVEILAFQDLMNLDRCEHLARHYLVRWLETIVDRLLPGTRLQVFGSTVTGMARPMSDIDIRVIDPQIEDSITKRAPSSGRPMALSTLRRKLETLRTKFAADSPFKEVDYRRGRVPVVTATHRTSGLEIQLSAKNDQLTSQEYVKNYLVEFPMSRPIFVVIRQMLDWRGLTDVFAGGLGSYSIFMMVIAFLKQHPPVRTDEFPLGRQLCAFLAFYADFKTYDVGLSIEPPSVFRKYPESGKPTLDEKKAIAQDSVLQGLQQISTIDEAKPYLLCLQDPANPKNDLGSKAYAIKHIQKTFSVARRNISECIKIWEENKSKTSSTDSVEYEALERAGLLWPLVGGNYAGFHECRRRIRSYGAQREVFEKERAEKENKRAKEASLAEDNIAAQVSMSTEEEMPTELQEEKPEFRDEDQTLEEADESAEGDSSSSQIDLPEDDITPEEEQETSQPETPTAPKQQESPFPNDSIG